MRLFRKKIGLALGAGGARGLAHIGVIKELERNNIAMDYIAGASIGALIGGLYAYTKDIRMIEDLAYSSNQKMFIHAFSDPSLKSSLFNGEKVLDILNDYIPQDALIQDTRIPFAAVATDMLTAEKVILKEGNLRQAIRASMSLPIILKPVRYNNMLLMDGGVVDPVPIDAARELGAQKVIGANLYANLFPRELGDNLNMIDAFWALIDAASYQISIRNMAEADASINLPTGATVSLSEFTKNPEKFIKIGEEETRKVMDKLKLL
jgi:NTE family protein